MCGWATPDRGEEGGRAGRMEFRGYDSPRQLLELEGVGLYLRPAVEGGELRGNCWRERWVEKLMMTK